MSEFNINNKKTVLGENNLYNSGFIDSFSDGVFELNREFVTYKRSDGDLYYTVRIGDEIDDISYRHYRESEENPSDLWWVIADANEIENPQDLSGLVGTEIVIPYLEQFRLQEAEQSNG